jgi:hypothetical protein
MFNRALFHEADFDNRRTFIEISATIPFLLEARSRLGFDSGVALDRAPAKLNSCSDSFPGQARLPVSRRPCFGSV